MQVIATLLGVGLLALAFVDLLWTSLWVSGRAGPLTERLSSWSWRFAVRRLRGRHRALSLFGPLSVVGAIVVWSLLLWLGWTLVFSLDSGAIRDADTGAAGDVIDRLYFTGYALFTMGNGDLAPGGNWRLVTVVMNASGIILLTLVVSYLISAISSVVHARAFAARLSATADAPQSLVLHAFEPGGPDRLGDALDSFSAEIIGIGQHHLAYPVLRFYHAADPRDASPIAVALLADALLLLRRLPPSERVDPLRLEALEGAIARYLDALASEEEPEAWERPPEPAVDRLPALGSQGDDTGTEAAERCRRRLHAVVRSSGWAWPAW